MTEREKKEICKGYADLIIKKEQLTRELWKTEFSIKKLEDVLTRNKILQQNSYQSRNNRTIKRICGRSKILAINQQV